MGEREGGRGEGVGGRGEGVGGRGEKGEGREGREEREGGRKGREGGRKGVERGRERGEGEGGSEVRKRMYRSEEKQEFEEQEKRNRMEWKRLSDRTI